MNSYQITIRKQGAVQKVIDSITAMNALQAIGYVEKNYDSKTFQLSDNGNKAKSYSWTGLEFEARELGMVLS